MTALVKDIGSGFTWIGQTFRQGTSEETKRDIPGWIARWFFRIGTIWAAILLPIMGIVCLIFFVAILGMVTHMAPIKSTDKIWLLCPYLISGYAIWLGWGWRSRKPRNVALCSLFWLASAAFNVMQPIHFWMDSHSFLIMLYPPPLWGIITTVGSLVALGWEFLPTKGKSRVEKD